MRYEATAKSSYRVVKINKRRKIVTVECYMPGQPLVTRELREGDTFDNTVTIRIPDVPAGIKIVIDDLPGTSWSYHA